jgi:divalent metal cation (Fe/Co/Zn/Cd) transporter
MSAETQLPVLPMVSTPEARAPAHRDRFVRRARQLAWVGLAWHVIEAAVALAAGVAAASVALIGFGADSLIEAAAGIVVLWLMASTRSSSPTAERRAQQLIAASFVVLAAYIGIEAIRDLAGSHRPDASWVGIILSIVTLATMPPLAAAKRRVGEQLGSSATTSALGWWWADPLVALAIAAVAAREARDSWRGNACSCCS